jgi:hypothetical protein
MVAGPQSEFVFLSVFDGPFMFQEIGGVLRIVEATF